MNKKILKIVYVAVFFIACALPGVMTFANKNEHIGNEQKVDIQNISYSNFSSVLDTWFSSSFGLRSEFIELNNRIRYNVFHQSGEDSVIVGKNGWLFYQSALHDYIGLDVISDAEAAKIVSILQIASDGVKEQQSMLIFVSPPNKMEIYGENMPYYCRESGEDGNYELIMAALNDTDVRYVDLKKVLLEKKETAGMEIYHKTDSHWNNLGAAAAYDAIMEEAGITHTDYSQIAVSVRENFSGDLYGMLFPKGNQKDAQVYFDIEDKFYYTSNFRTYDDMLITTENDMGSGSVLMYRDSFGNALYSFFANDFETAEFSRAMPYDLTDVSGKDVVVIELVERNLTNLLKYPPVVTAPVTHMFDSDVQTTVLPGEASVKIEEKGDNVLITFSSEDIPSDCTQMYVKITKDTDTVYRAYPSAEDGDGCFYISGEELNGYESISVIYETNGAYMEIYGR
ncbi:MAG: hypothetical protein ACI4EW_00585 [Butyrivibrio sp.]